MYMNVSETSLVGGVLVLGSLEGCSGSRLRGLGNSAKWVAHPLRFSMHTLFIYTELTPQHHRVGMYY